MCTQRVARVVAVAYAITGLHINAWLYKRQF